MATIGLGGGGDFLLYLDMKKFFKNLPLWNPWSDFEIISKEYFLGDSSQNFERSKTMAAMGGGDFLHYHMDMKKFLKNFLLQKRWSEFRIFSQDRSLCDPFQKLLMKFDSSKNMAAMGEAFFTVWTSEKFFLFLLLWNHLSDFEIISQDCSLDDPFQKLFAKFLSVEKYGRHGGKLFSVCGLQRNSSEFFSSETTCQILN